MKTESYQKAFVSRGDDAWVQLPGDPLTDLREVFAELERRASLPPEPEDYICTPAVLCRMQSFERHRALDAALAGFNRKARRITQARRRRGDHGTP